MDQVQLDCMDDIGGVGIPLLMPLPVEQGLIDEMLLYAGKLRTEGWRIAQREIASDKSATLRIMLTLLKAFAIARTEEYLASEAVRSNKIDCHAGCSHCCYQNVEVSIPEAILVSLQVANPEDPRRATILETADFVAKLDPQARTSCGRPCPLLVDHKCSVYENRPLLCRATLSPSERGCREALQGIVDNFQVYTLPQFVALSDKDGLRGICKDLGLQHDNVDLVQTVAAILRDPSKVVRWAEGEAVFDGLAQAKPLPQSIEPDAVVRF